MKNSTTLLYNDINYHVSLIFSARQHTAYICLARYILSPVRPFVRLSVTLVDHRKTIEVRFI